MILGPKRLWGRGSGTSLGQGTLALFWVGIKTQEKRLRMSLRSLAPFVRFIFIALFLPGRSRDDDELDESGMAGGSQLKVLGRN